MIRNRYNYLSPSVQATKGKEEHLKAKAPQLKSQQAESQKDSLYPPPPHPHSPPPHTHTRTHTKMAKRLSNP